MKARHMSSRSTETTVTFLHAFHMKGLEQPQPAGTYLVVTEEELLDALSFPAWQRTGTQLHLPAIGLPALLRQAISIDPVDLSAALVADGPSRTAPPAASPHPGGH
jgi:hypothetical protein